MDYSDPIYEDIQSRIDDYRVMAIDDNVVGCVALHEYPDENCAEVACLYVKMAHEGRGYGIELVRHAQKLASERGISRVFALSNRAADFFTIKLGYAPATVEDLPATRRAQFEASGRDSLVFSLKLAAERSGMGFGTPSLGDTPEMLIGEDWVHPHCHFMHMRRRLPRGWHKVLPVRFLPRVLIRQSPPPRRGNQW